MANDLKLQVLLQAMDKAAAPLKRIGAAGKTTAADLRGTRDSLRKLDELQQRVGDFRKVKAGARATSQEMEALQVRIGELTTKIRTNDGAVSKHAAELKRATRAASQLKEKHQIETEQLHQLRKGLAAADIDTRQLGNAEKSLRIAVSQTNTKLEQQTNQLRLQGVQAQRLAAIDKARRGTMAVRSDVGGKLAILSGAAIGAGYAMTRVLGSGAEFDYQMQLIGNTADMTGQQINDLRGKIMAASKSTGQSATNVQQALGFLVAAGLDTKTAAASIDTIGKTATAAGADIEDISRAAFTLTDALNIQPSGLQKAMDMLAQSGKEGNVELRDMAKVLPQFGSAFKAMKMQGPGAVATLGAALEIARKGAPDADTAANNMANYFQKILSPTVLQKAKSGFNIDLYKIITNAQSKGKNPFEASMRAVIKATGGDQKKIGELFQDAQVQGFVRPMIQNWKEYERIRDKSLAASGVTDRDFAKVAATTKQQMVDLQNAAGRLGIAFSHALAPSLGRAATALAPVLDRMTSFVQTNPGLVAGIVKVAGALFGLRLGFLAVRYASTFIGAQAMIARLKGMRAAIAEVGSGGALAKLRASASSVFPAVTTGARAAMLAVTGISLPVLAVGAVLAAVALVVWKYWGPIKAFFIGVGRGISQVLGPALDELGGALGPLKPAWDAIARGIGAVWGWITRLFTPFKATSAQIQGATENGIGFGLALGRMLSFSVKAITWVVKAFSGIGTAIGNLVGWVVVSGPKIAEGIRSAFATAFEWVGKKIDWIVTKWNALKHALHLGDDNADGAAPKRNWAFNDGAMPAPNPAFDTRPPLRNKGAIAAQGNTYVGGITIHAPAGADPKAIARETAAELDRRERAKGAARRSSLHDHD